jgi:hypothetical protein
MERLSALAFQLLHHPPKQSAMSTSFPDLAAIKQRQQATWASGDFSVIGVTLRPPTTGCKCSAIATDPRIKPTRRSMPAASRR